MVFSGAVAAVTRLSELIADSITGALISGGTITGTTFQTAALGTARIYLSASAAAIQAIGFDTTRVNQLDIGRVQMESDINSALLRLAAPQMSSTANTGMLLLKSQTAGGIASAADLLVDKLNLGFDGALFHDVFATPPRLDFLGTILRIAAGLKIGAVANSAINQFDYGFAENVVNATSEFKIPHSLGVMPVIIILQNYAGGGAVASQLVVSAKSTINFTLKARTTAGAGQPQGTAVNAYWLAIA